MQTLIRIDVLSPTVESSIMMRVAALLAVLCAAVAATAVSAGALPSYGPAVNIQTVPTLQWTLSLNTTGVPLHPDIVALADNPPPEPAKFFAIVTNQTLSYVHALTGVVTSSVQLPAPSTSTCFQPVGSSSPNSFFVTCTPNILVSVLMGTIVWSREILSNVTLPATGTRTPVFTGPPVLASAGADPLVLVAGSGALFTLYQDNNIAPEARPQYGPVDTNVLASFIDLQVTSLDESSPSLVVTAHGPAVPPSAVVPGAIFQMTIGATAKTPFAISDVNLRGNDSFPITSFYASAFPATQRVYISAVYQSGAKTGSAMEIFQFHYNAATPPASRFLAQAFNSHPEQGVIESADGQYIVPKRIADEIPVMRVSDGTIVQNWPITASNLSSLLQSTLSFDGPNLYLTTSNNLAVLPFNPSADRLDQFLWSFSFYQNAADPTAFGPYLPAAVVQQISFAATSAGGLLLVRTRFDPNNAEQSSFDSTMNDRLWVFNSTVAGGCGSLPDADDNCGTCDGKTGVLTARNCAYCSASSTCVGYSFTGIPSLNQTCSDSDFPESLDTCNGGPADKHVAIIVGSIVGGVVVLSGVICYLAKRKPTVQSSEAEPNFSTAGQPNYQTL
jgi:hypothetical protein